jgi:hypothetical protein
MTRVSQPSDMTSVIDCHETNLDSRALAVDLIRQGHNAVMDCDVKRVMPLVREATQDMSPEQLRRLVHQLSWVSGALAALLPDDKRLASLAGFVVTNGDQS